MTTSVAQPQLQNSPQPENEPLVSNRVIIWSLVALTVLGIAFIGLFIWLAFAFPERIEALRDVMIMLFALVSCSAVIVLVILLVAVIRLINMLQFEIKPLLEKTTETVSLIQGTTSFVGTHVVKPTIETTSFLAGVRKGFVTLFGNPKRNLPK